MRGPLFFFNKFSGRIFNKRGEYAGGYGFLLPRPIGLRSERFGSRFEPERRTLVHTMKKLGVRR